MENFNAGFHDIILPGDTRMWYYGMQLGEERARRLAQFLEIDRPVSCSDTKPVISFLNGKINRHNEVFFQYSNS